MARLRDDEEYRTLNEQHAQRLEEGAAELLSMANQIRRDAGLIEGETFYTDEAFIDSLK